jgi:hypothetical protein
MDLKVMDCSSNRRFSETHHDQILNEFREAEDTEGMISSGQIELPPSPVGNLLKFIYYNLIESSRSRSMLDLRAEVAARSLEAA